MKPVEQPDVATQKGQHGGARPGGGRPKGAKSRPDRKIVVQLEPIAVEKHDVRPLALRARDYTGLSLKAYVDVLKKPDAADGDKIRAATEILNRGYGRSAEIVSVTSTNIFAGLTDDDLVAAIRALRSAAEDGGSAGTLIDVTPGEAVADGVGAAPSVQTGEASPLPAAETAAGGGEPQ